MALTEEGIIHVPGMLSRWVRLGSGARAHYMTSGETGPSVVLLHGGIIGSSGTAGWRFMAPWLGENGFRVYCPDMPGFGLTVADDHQYDYGDAAHVDFVQDFANALCLETFHVAGNSMGCSNTVNYVVAHPERVRSFALIAGTIGDLVPWETLRAADPRPVDARPTVQKFDGTAASMHQMMSSIIHRGEAITDDVISMRTEAALRNAELYGIHMSRVIQQRSPESADVNIAARLSTTGRFDRLTVPGIYLYGREDVLAPVESGYMQEDVLPNVQFFYPEDTGHQGQTDRPELFGQTFLEFFRDGRVSHETAELAGVSTRRPVNPALVTASDSG